MLFNVRKFSLLRIISLLNQKTLLYLHRKNEERCKKIEVKFVMTAVLCLKKIFYSSLKKRSSDEFWHPDWINHIQLKV